MADDLVERRFLLIKRGLYYGPDNRGYTGFKERAGRYLESDADPISGVTAVHEDEAGEIAPSCFDDLARGWLQSKLAEARAENARLTEERDAFRTMAIKHLWNHNLANAYGREEYQRQLGQQVDETLENMLAKVKREGGE